MKKTTILCLLEDRRDALEKLASLGFLHVDAAELKDSEDRKSLENLYSETTKALNLISGIDESGGDNEYIEFPGEQLVLKILEKSEEKSELNKRQDSLSLDRNLLLPWGDFSPELLKDLREDGMNIYLCASQKSSLKLPKSASIDGKTSAVAKSLAKTTGQKPEEIIVKIIREQKNNIWFAVISSEEIDKDLLPLDNIPDSSLKETEEEIEKTRLDLKRNEEDFAKLAYYNSTIDSYLAELEEKIEFASARDSMGENEAVVYIDGYVPVPDVEKLQATAKERGWGLMLRDPKPEENPPTLIKTPRILEMSKPIFNFIGISPGYREWDVSGCFLFFFTVFFGIIVGDAGYGAIFLILSILAKIKFRNKEKLKLPIRLFILLSCSTIVWGLLNGTVFAIPGEHLPVWMRGVGWLTDPAVKDQHIQQLCFLIAALHLSLGHLWKAILFINSRKALGELGWTALLWGNYLVALNLIVYPERAWPEKTIYVLYGSGLALTILFAVNWRKIGDIFNYPFGVIGTFVDLLSYIRLFAVGLATYYISKSFNDMGLMVYKSFEVDNFFVMIFVVMGALLLIFGGHLLNIVLALLAVLVHGIRLNTLEFSNHMNLQWLGYVYKPFKKKNPESETETEEEG